MIGGVAIVCIEGKPVSRAHHDAVEVDGWRHVAAARSVGMHIGACTKQTTGCTAAKQQKVAIKICWHGSIKKCAEQKKLRLFLISTEVAPENWSS